MLFPTLGPSSLPVLVAQPDERHAKRTASVLEMAMTDTEYSITSSSNEEEPLTKDMQTKSFYIEMV